jgi:hypothetical protein
LTPTGTRVGAKPRDPHDQEDFMKLRRRQKGKKEQAVDSFASVVKSLAELHLAERAGKGVGKGAKSVSKSVKKASRLKGVIKSTPAKVVGGAAVAGGAGALIAKKLKGGDPEPIYTPPAPAEPMAVAPAPEVEAVVAAAAEAAAADAPADPGGEDSGESGVVVELVAEPPPDEPGGGAEPAVASENGAEEPARADASAEPEPAAAGTDPPGGSEGDDKPASSHETWST